MATALWLLALLLVPAAPAAAAEWGGIEPGVTETREVRQRYGPPSAEKAVKVEGYDTLEWVYEKDKAPSGLVRMTVEFGLLTPSGYKPTLVRLLKLEPKPAIFGRNTVVEGWGIPDGVGTQDGVATLFYKAGLVVVFDREGANAVSMIFSIPQPDPAPAAADPPARPKP